MHKLKKKQWDDDLRCQDGDCLWGRWSRAQAERSASKVLGVLVPNLGMYIIIVIFITTYIIIYTTLDTL